MQRQRQSNPHNFGQHRGWTENDDMVVVLWNGDVLGTDIDEVGMLIETLPTQQQKIALVQDVSKVTSFTPEAREKILNNKSSMRLTLVVLIGASFQVRMVQRMINRAMRILRKSVGELVFADSLDDARRLVQKHRHS